MPNADIRSAAMYANVKLWQIAHEVGVSESYFSRMMRHELPENKKKEVFDAIKRIKEGK